MALFKIFIVLWLEKYFLKDLWKILQLFLFWSIGLCMIFTLYFLKLKFLNNENLTLL